ncbi:unnamed protein product [Cylindrotheca closterium]|uniref:DUF6824 domain-containing protein n=1 Tax=Cylindrotheca closterium TaxID=2856 RepID=A0AAD2FNW7_9STRA|nr:unnamed protein product [Cylindrotheca closterium]
MQQKTTSGNNVIWNFFTPSSSVVSQYYSSNNTQNTPKCTKEEIDSFLAQSITSLTFQEREAAYEELHGIVSANEETIERISQWLRSFETYLNTVHTVGSAYEVAEAMDRSYVTAQEFRMMFLRADRYNIEKAVHRMIKFMEIKKTLFGVGKLVQTITLQDLNDDDIACLRNGSVQIAPVQDIAGRQILVGIPCLRQYKSMESELRARYYVIMTLVEREETQIHGAIGIWYAVAPSNSPATEQKYGSNSGLLWTLPIHWAAAHFCCDSFLAYVFSSAGILLSNAAHRIRVHYGDHSKCHRQLLTFGIPREGIPLNDKMEALLEAHEQWFESRKEQELIMVATNEARAQSPFSIQVRPEDVLFGRGRGVHEHQGNVKLRYLIASHQDAYNKAPITERTEIALGIVGQIKKRGGRFLKNEAEDWIEASTKESRAKITMAFRSKRKTKG